MTEKAFGYLDPNFDIIKQSIKKNFSPFFEIAYKIISFSYEVKNKLKTPNNDLQKILCSCLFLRITNGFESIIILSEYGLEIESKVITRSMLEAFFLMANIIKDKNIIDSYIQEDFLNRIKIINAIKNDYKDSFNPAIAKNLSTELEAEIIKNSKLNDKLPPIEQLAKNVNFDSLYQNAYRLLSSDTHILPRSLEYYLTIDENTGIIKNISILPEHIDLSFIFITSLMIFIYSLDQINDFFSLKLQNVITEYWEEFKSIAE